MIAGQLAEIPAILPPDLEDLAARIEAALERGGGWRGMTPAAAARAARCTTGEAATVLAWLVGHQLANSRNAARFYAGRYHTERNR